MTTASTIQLTPAERGAFGHFFALADPQSTGVVSGNSAVSFFALSGLPSPVLGSIWTIADKDNNGFLTPADFSSALRLIGHAQSGKVVTEDLIQQPGPLPTFKGVVLPPHLAATASGGISTPTRSSSTFVQPQSTGNANEIRPEDRARYTRIFASAGPQSGLLDGEKAKEIFVKSKLPFDKLGAIWNLADTKARGKLDLTDFMIGMHFIQSTMNGSLSSIPTTLPAGLYEKAASGSGGMISGLPPTSPLSVQNTGGSAAGGPTGFIAHQMTGQGFLFVTPGSPVPSTIRSPPPSSLQPQRTGTGLFNTQSAIRPNFTGNTNWAVSPADKSKADQFFDGLDQDRKGVLEGQAAVPFFMQSGLDETTLAHVWDLSDITQSGSLTRDEFAVAMHLINLKLTGSDLPQELPKSLIPPSLQGQILPQAVNPQETDTQKDLFSLMDDDIDLPVSTTNAFAKPAIAPPAATTSTATTSKGAFDSAFDDDFIDNNNAGKVSSGFASPVPAPASTAGMTALSPVPTGTSTSGGIRSAAQAFGDASTDAANQRLALESTQKSLSGLETTKSDLSKSVAADANSIEDLRTRLETVRMRHQTESEAVKALQDRQKAQVAELKKLREESVHEESELSRLKAEKDEIEQALLKDREDVREMKRIVGERTKEKETLKVEIEKLKKDARQQKGLVAIGKKQLSQAESDLSKTQEELSAAKAEGEVEEHAAHGEVPVTTSQTVNPSREAALSPAASVRSTNPFDRLSSSGGAIAAGGAVGAVAAGVGAEALSHHNQQAVTSAEEQGTSTLDDPFGLSGSQSKAVETNENANNAAFDDSFGVETPTIPSNTEALAAPTNSNINQSFDDAFADLDSPAAVPSSDPTAPEPTSEAVPGSFGGQHVSNEEPMDKAVLGGETETAVNDFKTESNMEDPQINAIPSTIDAPAHADEEPILTSNDKGKEVARSIEDDQHDDSSDDDEEGPEDFEGHGNRMMDSPDEMGKGKSINDEVNQDLSSETAERFPEIQDEEMTGKAPLAPSAITSDATPTYSAMATPLAASVTGTTDAGTSVKDAFHDASDDVTPFDNPIVPGSTTSSVINPGHDRFSTAIESKEDHEPTIVSDPAAIASTQQRGISPAKARRAPPAVPTRGGTGGGLTGTGIGNNVNAGPFGMNEDAAQSTNNNTIDDFDAAFEDLGPTAQGNGFNGETGNISNVSGFDDTFGEADGFDFVPSFSTNNFTDTSGQNSTNPTSTTSGAINGGTGAFDGFDSTFENAFETPSNKGQAPNTINAHAGQTSSNTGSGFSFDDAFIPAEAISTGKTPPQSTINLFSSTGTESGSTAPSLPSRSIPVSSTTTTNSASTGALPDDAGPVKQLCSMGFTRQNVIKALEKSNYRTDKALERLLAQS